MSNYARNVQNFNLKCIDIIGDREYHTFKMILLL